VKGPLEADDGELTGAADLLAVRARQLDGALRGLGAGREQKDLLERRRRETRRYSTSAARAALGKQ